ncbi:MAG: hypothetical protein JWL91_2484 [Sphingomonas bacterium]|jgi:hypothetical protein|nr:hypothetical protein [Sphingomonas bacterium]MDB5690608.1 hypothetical protein [Sphingomonas bacterium]
MQKVLTKLVAGLALTSAAVVAVPAEARPRYDGGPGYGRGYGNGYGGGYDRGRGYGRGYYAPRGRGYYAPPRAYGYGYGYDRPYRGYGGGYYGYPRYGYRDNGAGLAIGAGVLGLALGAAIASDRGDYYGY